MRTIRLLLLAQILLSAATPPRISFYARRDTPVGSGNLLGAEETPSYLTIADFNGDGLPDIAVLSTSTNTLFVLLSQGDGSFKQAGQSINAGLVPTAVVAGDFNNDGIQDLAVVSLSGTGILIGNGDGTFQPLANIRDAFGNAIAAADFNGDGNLDLVVGDSQFGTLDLLLGNGNGTFQPIVALPPAGNPASLAVADLNNDGIPDLVLATGANGQIVTLLNNGSATFEEAGAVSVPGAMVMAVGDFNNDGNIDVACATLVSGSAEVVLLLGEGNGKLNAPTNVVSEGSPTGNAAVAVGDFNGDGKLDMVAVLNSLSGSDTQVLLGNGDGTFQKPKSYSMGGPTALGVADFNGDNKNDIVTANAYVQISLASVLLGKGNGDFQSAPETALTAFPTGTNYVGVAGADLNNNGLTDFVVAETTGTQVLLAAGDNQFTIGQFISTVGTALALTDVNGDGFPDLILTSTKTNNVAVFLGNGDGTFQPALNSNAKAGQFGVAVGDFNNDGKPDLAVMVAPNDVGVMLGDGNGNFAPPVQLSALGADPDAIAVGDFNNDGKLDVAVANFGMQSATAPSSIFVFLGNGDGTLQPPTTLPMSTGAGPTDVEVADLNGDGNLDIVSADNNTSSISVYFGNGNGTFQSPKSLFSSFAPTGVRIADFNGDGIPDIAVLNDGNYDVGVLAGKGGGTFAPAVFFGAGPFPYTMAVGTLAQGEKPGLLLVDNEFGPQPSYTVLRNTSK